MRLRGCWHEGGGFTRAGGRFNGLCNGASFIVLERSIHGVQGWAGINALLVDRWARAVSGGVWGRVSPHVCHHGCAVVRTNHGLGASTRIAAPRALQAIAAFPVSLVLVKGDAVAALAGAAGALEFYLGHLRNKKEKK